MELCSTHLVGQRKLTLPFPTGMKSLAQQQLPWCLQWFGLCRRSPALSPWCVWRMSCRAVHELSVSPGLPGALAELPLPYLYHF